MGSGGSGYGIGRGGGGGTSGSSDGGYKGGAGSHHAIGDNLDALKSKFDYHDGYFGEKGDGRRTRHEYSDDPVAQARDFYDTAGYGGVEKPMPNGEGVTCTMKDGTVISMREVSHSDGTPAVDINIRKSDDSGGVKQQKIHFMPKKED